MLNASALQSMARRPGVTCGSAPVASGALGGDGAEAHANSLAQRFLERGLKHARLNDRPAWAATECAGQVHYELNRLLGCIEREHFDSSAIGLKERLKNISDYAVDLVVHVRRLD